MRSFRPFRAEDAHWFCQEVLKNVAVYHHAMVSANRPEAAEKLGISSKRVGQVLAEMETSLKEFLNGGSLIKRAKKIEIEPTEAGIVLAQFSKRILNLGEEFLAELWRVQFGNDITVATIHSAWMAHGPFLQAAYQKRTKGGTITFKPIGGADYMNLIRDEVAEGRADIGITSYPPKVGKSLVMQPLKDLEMRFIISADLPTPPRGLQISLATMLRDLSFKLVLHERKVESPLANKVVRYLRRNNIEFLQIQRVDAANISDIIATVIQIPNTGSILPIDAIDYEIKNKRLRSYSLTPPMEPWTWGLIYPSGTSRPAINHFLDCLRPLFKHKALPRTSASSLKA